MAARLTTLIVLVIVAATLIAGLIVGAQRDDTEGPVDLIVHNAVIYTANEQGAMAEAVAIRGNQILRVGSDREITRLRRPQTIVIDARGATVLPGFNDAHVELMAGGALHSRLDLLNASSIEEVERRVRDWADANPDEPWVLGRGWHAGIFADGPPTRVLLDRLVPDRPAQILSADGHSAWVNSKALQAAGIARRTANPDDGVIVRDPRSGEATGLLQESAVSLVSRLIPAPAAADRNRALRAAIAEAHRYGVTSLQDVGGTLDDLAVYAEARRTGDLRIRVYAAVPLPGDLPDADLDRLEAVTAKYPDDPLFKAGAVTVEVDGSAPAGVGIHKSAPLKAASASRFDPDALNKLVRRLDARDWQILASASGERATTMSLDAYAHAVRSNPDRRGERRHRIENAAAIASDDLPRLALLGILASMRPLAASAGPDIASRPDPDGSAQIAMPSLPRAVTAANGRIAFGSGWPAAPLDPLPGLRAGLDLTTSEDGSEKPRVSLKSVIDAYTSSSAWASFDEQRKGAIAPGMLADLAVLSENIFKSPGTALTTAHVQLTIFDGKIVYRRPQSGTN